MRQWYRCFILVKEPGGRCFHQVPLGAQPQHLLGAASTWWLCPSEAKSQWAWRGALWDVVPYYKAAASRVRSNGWSWWLCPSPDVQQDAAGGHGKECPLIVPRDGGWHLSWSLAFEAVPSFMHAELDPQMIQHQPPWACGCISFDGCWGHVHC